MTATSSFTIMAIFTVRVLYCTVQYDVLYDYTARELGPLRGGTIEFALCAVEGKTGKGIIS
jgi:hypothetical protein